MVIKNKRFFWWVYWQDFTTILSNEILHFNCPWRGFFSIDKLMVGYSLRCKVYPHGSRFKVNWNPFENHKYYKHVYCEGELLNPAQQKLLPGNNPLLLCCIQAPRSDHNKTTLFTLILNNILQLQLSVFFLHHLSNCVLLCFLLTIYRSFIYYYSKQISINLFPHYKVKIHKI